MAVPSTPSRSATSRTAASESTSASTTPSSSTPTQLDCRKLNCPMPIVKIAKAFRTLQKGDRLEVLATDPAFRADIEAWARKTGQTIVRFDDGATKTALFEKTK